MWNLKKPNSEKPRVEWWLPGAGDGVHGGNGELDQRTQTSSYKVNKFWGSNVQNVQNNTVQGKKEGTN